MGFFSVLLQISSFSMIGVLIRYYLEIGLDPSGLKLLDSDSADFLDLGSNCLGTFIIGIVVVLKPLILEFYEPILFGLSTGLCGSITTYSSWNNQITQLFLAGTPQKAILCIFIGLSLPYSSIQFGMLVGNYIKTLEIKKIKEKKKKIIIWVFNIFASIVIFFSITFMIIAVAFDQSEESKKVWVAVCIGPIGSFFRWRLSKFNPTLNQTILSLNHNIQHDVNEKIISGVQKISYLTLIKSIPWGTISANVIACWTYELFLVIKYYQTGYTWIIKSVQLGFLGCLSTISTFISEIHSISNQAQHNFSWLYIITSLFLSLSGSLILSTIIP